MTVEFRMPDGTHIRINEDIADQMPADWERLDTLSDATEGFVSLSAIQDEDVKAKPAPQVKAKPRKPPEA